MFSLRISLSFSQFIHLSIYLFLLSFPFVFRVRASLSSLSILIFSRLISWGSYYAPYPYHSITQSVYPCLSVSCYPFLLFSRQEHHYLHSASLFSHLISWGNYYVLYSCQHHCQSIHLSIYLFLLYFYFQGNNIIIFNQHPYLFSSNIMR